MLPGVAVTPALLCISMDQPKHLQKENDALMQSEQIDTSEDTLTETTTSSYPEDTVADYEKACTAVPGSTIITQPGYTISCIDTASGVTSIKIFGEMPVCIPNTENCEGIEPEELLEAKMESLNILDNFPGLECSVVFD